MAYASSLLAFPFRSVALPLCVRLNLAIDNDSDDDDYDDNDDVSAYVVASPTSRSALVFTMPTRPCMFNAFLVLSEGIMRNGREGRYQAETRWGMPRRERREKGGNMTR